MKSLILLLLLMSTAYSNLPRCTNEINAIRRRYANEFSTANMNKLAYNPKWEKKILGKLESSGGCPDKSGEYEDGFVFGLNIRNWKGFQLHVASNSESMEIACVETRCERDGELITSAVFDIG
ncbi:Protein CBG18667 [Caenorhabditis briggsae]|nr:Protein CBG18667 [Caenorhabditis briggsae]CAP36076.1 Protein CBG18667 [Caenorhabditis briggsae]